MVGSIRFDIGSIYFDIGSIHFDIGSIYFDIGSIHFDIGSIHFDIGWIYFDIGSIYFDIGSIYFDIGSIYFDIGSIYFDIGWIDSDVFRKGFRLLLVGPAGQPQISAQIRLTGSHEPVSHGSGTPAETGTQAPPRATSGWQNCPSQWRPVNTLSHCPSTQGPPAV